AGRLGLLRTHLSEIEQQAQVSTPGADRLARVLGLKAHQFEHRRHGSAYGVVDLVSLRNATRTQALAVAPLPLALLLVPSRCFPRHVPSLRYAERHYATALDDRETGRRKAQSPSIWLGRGLPEMLWPETAAPGAGGHRAGDSGTASEDAGEDSPDLVGPGRVGRQDRECGIRERVT